jgi:hypothetical protein
MKSILDPSFRYTPSYSTDLQKTFAKIRRDRQRSANSAAPAVVVTLATVSSIGVRTASGR